MIESAKKNELLNPILRDEETEMEMTLRPDDFVGYIGQTVVKRNMKIYVEAARKRGESLDHVLIYGPPGLGKTTLAGVLAKEMGVNLRITAGPALTRTGDLASILTNLKTNDFLFIDEIHRLAKNVEEVLYTAMEDFAVDIVVGKGPAAKTVRLNLEPFTLVGATTKIGNLSGPLRDRFGVIERLDFYQETEIEQILVKSAEKLGIKYEKGVLKEVSKCCRGTPRVANRVLKRLRDFAEIKSGGVLNEQMVKTGLVALGIDNLGLNSFDRFLLVCMVEKFAGGPVGLDTLAAATSEDRETIEEVSEPYLLRLGLIEKTSRGRKVTIKGRKIVGMEKN